MRVVALVACLCLSILQPVRADLGAAAYGDIEWTEAGLKDFEKDNPGFGYSQSYQSSAGWITKYSFTGGYRDWQDGLHDPRLQQFLDDAIHAVRIQAEQGVYLDLDVSPVKTRNIAGIPYHHVDFRYTANGALMHSSLYLTVKDGLLLKYRISYQSEPPSSRDEVSANFIARTQGAPVSPPDKVAKRPAPGGRPPP